MAGWQCLIPPFLFISALESEPWQLVLFHVAVEVRLRWIHILPIHLPGLTIQRDILDPSMIPCNAFYFHHFFLNFLSFFKIPNQICSNNVLKENMKLPMSRNYHQIKVKIPCGISNETCIVLELSSEREQ